MKLKQIFLSIIVFLLLCGNAKKVKRKKTQCSSNNSFRSVDFNLFGLRTLYKRHQQAFGAAAFERPSPASGCTPVHVYALLRHGARYPHKNTLETQRKLLRLTKLLNQTGKAKQCSKDLERLQAWRPWVDEYIDKNQTSYGDDEVRNITKRFISSFPEIFPPEAQPQDYSFRSSDYQRTIASMHVSAEEIFKQGRSEVEVEEAIANAQLQIVPIEEDTVLRFNKNCKKFLTLKKTASVHSKHKKFLKGKLMKRLLRSFSSRLGVRETSITTKDVFQAFLDGCALEQWVETANGPWCFPFSKKEFVALNYASDLKSYGGLSQNNVSVEMSCELAKDIVSSIKTASEADVSMQRHPKATFRFSHFTTMLPLAANMQLYDTSAESRIATTYRSIRSKTRELNMSKMMPSAGNFAFILYKCGNQYKVQLYWNEKLQPIPACANSDSPTFCDLSTFLNFYHSFVMGSATECNHAEICENDL